MGPPLHINRPEDVPVAAGSAGSGRAGGDGICHPGDCINRPQQPLPRVRLSRSKTMAENVSGRPVLVNDGQVEFNLRSMHIAIRKGRHLSWIDGREDERSRHPICRAIVGLRADDKNTGMNDRRRALYLTISQPVRTGTKVCS